MDTEQLPLQLIEELQAVEEVQLLHLLMQHLEAQQEEQEQQL